MTTRDEIVCAARSFLGVRFAHQGRSAHGLDCLGLLLATAQKVGLHLQGMTPAALDVRDYGSRPDVEHLQRMLNQYLQPVSAMAPADVLLLRIGGRPQHLALVSDYPQAGSYGMIHAYALARKVIEHRLDDHWAKQIAGIYRIVGVA